MPHALEISSDDIQNLDGGQLQTLLGRLLHLEAKSCGILASAVRTTDAAQITVSDGGEDARIQWTGGPDSTGFVPCRFTLYQSKAKDMGRAACRDEVLSSDGGIVSQVGEVLDAGGAYIIFCRQPAVGRHLRNRILGIREGLRIGGRSDSDSAKVDFYDANAIRDWVNTYPGAMHWVRETIGRVTWPAFQTWTSWSRDQAMREFEFVEDSKLRSQIDNLRSRFAQPKITARLIGLSGIGKTRLALETFRPPEDSTTGAAQEALSNSVLYVDAASRGSDIIEKLEALRNEGLEVLVIVDECDDDLNDNLMRIARHMDSKISLLTLDFEPPRGTPSPDHLVIDNASKDVIKGILEQRYTTLSQPDLQRIVEFAQGFPKMAVLLAEARLVDAADLGQLTDNKMLERMHWGRGSVDEAAKKVISTCALFDKLGFREGVQSQMAFVAEHIARIDEDTFYEKVQYFRQRRIIQFYGRFLQVQPRPLALRLAADRWRDFRPDRARDLFQQTMPPGMVESLCDQLRMLDNLPEAQAIVADLCGPLGPFGTAEALNTSQGSRCFRSLVEVNPQEAIDALSRSFGSWSTNELLTVGPGRRDLVWALEKLAFRRETFPAAARLLLAFAAAENEGWGNNATGQFLQLFHLVLSGTEAPPEDRWPVLDEALTSDEEKKRKIALKALDTSLTTHFFSRMGGAERQGSGPELQDWYPRNRNERTTFFQDGLRRLRDFALSDDSLAAEAKSTIGSSLRGLISEGLLDDVEDVVTQICAKQHDVWIKAFESVGDSLRYDLKDAPSEIKDRVRAISNFLFPKDLPSRIQLQVVQRPIFLYEDGDDLDTLEFRMKGELSSLAQELANDPSSIDEVLPMLLIGSQNQSYLFGTYLVKFVHSPMSLISKIAEILKRSDELSANPSLFLGVLQGLADEHRELVDEALDHIADDLALVNFLPYLSTAVQIGSKELDRIGAAIRQDILPVEQVRSLAWGQALAKVSESVLGEFIEYLIGKGKAGAWVSIDIIAMYGHGHLDRLKPIVSIIEKAVLMPGILDRDRKSGSQIDVYHFGELARWLMSEPEGAVAARSLAEEIIRICHLKFFPYDLEHMLDEVLRYMFDKYASEVWPTFEVAICSGDPLVEIQIEHILGSKRFSKERGVVEHVPSEVLIDWCRRDRKVAAPFVMKIAPLFQATLDHDDGTMEWSPLVKQLLDEFGDQKEVLSALTANIGTFGWTGSLVQYYRQYLGPLESLSNHRHASVREWALAELRYIEERMEDAERRDAEHEIGIF